MTNILDLTAYKDGTFLPLGYAGPSILDFGFIHCDATYDVMPVYNKRAFCLDRHIARFKNSAARYRLNLPEVDFFEIASFLVETNNLNDAFVWFMAWRGFPKSGNPRDIHGCKTHFAMYAKPSYPLVNKQSISVFLDKTALRVEDQFFGQEYKNFSWIDLTQAQLNVPDEYDTVVLVDSRGCLTEGPGFNVAVVMEESIYVPYRNCLKGITMSVVEDIAKELNIRVVKTDVPADYWNTADETFLTSSSGGVTPVRNGPITELLIKEYELKKYSDVYSTKLKR
jgi:branched-chain amino acid aminotransferase